MKYFFKSKYFMIAVAIIFIVALGTITMSSSPLYVTNQWSDTNAMFTMGRSLVDGMVPFRDVVDQRGPVLYGLFAIASAISSTTFNGVFIIELLNLIVVYYFTVLISRIFLKDKFVAYIIAVVGPTVLVGTKAFVLGGAPEEFAFPVVLGFIYLALKWQNTQDNLQLRDFFFAGFGLFYLFWIKYSMLGALVVFFIYIGIDMIVRREWKKLVMVVAIAILGFLVPSALLMGLFYSHHSLKDMFKIYFLLNMNSYGENKNGQIWQVWYDMKLAATPIAQHWLVTFVTMATLAINRKKKNSSLILFMFIGTVIMMILSHYVRDYYIELLMPFFVLALIQILTLTMEQLNVSRVPFLISVLLSSAVIPFYANTYLSTVTPKDAYKPFLDHGKPSDSTLQTQFAETMIKKSHGNPTLLMINSLDTGFYLAAHTHPTTKYFHKLNLSYDQYPEMYNSFSDSLNKKKVQFVVVMVNNGNPSVVKPEEAINSIAPVNRGPLSKNYHMIDYGFQKVVGQAHNWALFEAKR
ncbi:hypothetical protein ACWM0G_09805 [Weissella cibaria]